MLCRILYEGKSRLMEGCEVVSSTPTGLQANVNSRIGVSSQRAYITFRKAKADSPHNTLAVIDITVILTNKVSQRSAAITTQIRICCHLRVSN